MLTNILILLVLLLECYNTFIKDRIKVYKEEEYEEEIVDEKPNLDTVAFQQQMYNVEKFRERIKKLQEAQNTDEDGLFDASVNVTLEDLGYFTGVEDNN